jgi:ribosomal protein S18 acetylase RimI-like enzyme
MIAVDPDHQRVGVGTSLMERAIAHVEELGLALAVVSTGGDPGHDGARALYERLGFTPMPLVRHYRAL